MPSPDRTLVCSQQPSPSRSDERGAGASQDAGARESRVTSGQRDPAQGLGVFCPGGARPPREVMLSFIDAHRDAYGVEPICAGLRIAPSAYYEHRARDADTSRLPPRFRRDEALRAGIVPVWRENFEVYGVRNMWRQLNREGIEVARLYGRAVDACHGLVRRGSGEEAQDDARCRRAASSFGSGEPRLPRHNPGCTSRFSQHTFLDVATMAIDGVPPGR
jgi:hypothetical protein